MKFRSVERNQLYYSQYQYCISFFLKNVSVLRDLDVSRLARTIRYRNEWANSIRLGPKITEEEGRKFQRLCDYLLARTHPFKRTTTTHAMYIYTNNPEDFENLHEVCDLVVTGRLRVNQCLQPNAVTLKNPVHQYRTFFKERWLANHELENLRNYFNTRSDQFRFSPGFQLLLKGRRLWLMGNYFVDHNEPQADFLINMAVPGIVKKTLPIVARG